MFDLQIAIVPNILGKIIAKKGHLEINKNSLINFYFQRIVADLLSERFRRKELSNKNKKIRNRVFG